MQYATSFNYKRANIMLDNMFTRHHLLAKLDPGMCF